MVSTHKNKPPSASNSKLAILITLLFFAVSYYLLAPEIKSSRFAEKRLTTQINNLPVDSKIPSVLNVPPSLMRIALQDSYRLKPDKRFLLAIANIHHFITGEPKEEATVHFQEGTWSIRYKDKAVGTVPELPDFSDFIFTLDLWVGQLLFKSRINLTIAETPLPEDLKIQENLRQFFSPYLMDSARKLNGLWEKGNRHPLLLRYSTQILVSLTLQYMDHIETADGLPASALAILVLTKRLTDYDVSREEGLLAYLMGYSRHAINISQSLEKEDPVKLFVNHNDFELEKFANHDNSSQETRYLFLTRLAKKEDLEEWLRWLGKAFANFELSLSILKTGLELKSFYGNREFPKEIRYLVFREIDHNIRGEQAKKSPQEVIRTIIENNTYYKILSETLDLDGLSESDLIHRFDSELKKVTEKYRGPLIKGQVIKDFYRGSFYSSFYVEGLHYLDSISSHELALKFSHDIGFDTQFTLKRISSELKEIWAKRENIILRIIYTVQLYIRTTLKPVIKLFKAALIKVNLWEQSTGDNFIRWYGNLIYSAAGKGNVNNIANDIIFLKRIGGPPLLRSYKETKRHFNFGDSARNKVLKRLAFSLDSRTSNRAEWAWIAKKELLNIHLFDKYYTSAIKIDPSRSDSKRAWFFFYTENTTGLKDMLRSKNTSMEVKSRILFYLKKQNGLTKNELINEYEILLNNDKRNWNLVDNYANYLKEVEEYSRSRKISLDWLNLKVIVSGLEKVVAINNVADTYYQEGEYEKGLQSVEPAFQSGQGGALYIKAKILNKLGHIEVAEEILKYAYNRYRNHTKYLARLAGFLWEHDRFDEAAETIAQHPFKLTAQDWMNYFGEQFAEVFKDKHGGKLALKALKAKGVSAFNIMEMARKAEFKGHPELAFQIASDLKDQVIPQSYFQLQNYSFLKKFKTKNEALSWLKKAIPPSAANRASMFFYEDGEYDLLWDLMPSPDIYGWILRAGVFLFHDSENTDKRKQLEEYFTGQNVHPVYGTFGRYLLGLEPVEKMFQIATSAQTRCEAAYFIGLKYQSEGLYEEASDWYQVALETGQSTSIGYRWSHSILQKWNNKARSLTVLANKQI